MRPDREPIDPEALADVVKEDVAGLDDRAMERDGAVALLPPASIFAPAKVDSARAAERRVGSDRVIFKTCDGADDLEG